MEIVKEAFVEGRETDTKWGKSKANNNQFKLDIAIENLSMMKKREFHSVIPLHQIDPKTGKVINTFQSRIAAARYIVKEILKNPEKNPLSITGNMEMCMRAGWKAYGFYWKIATSASIEKYTKPTVANAKRVYVTYQQKGGVFNSIQSAADAFGLSPKTIAHRLKPNSNHLSNYVIQEYNPSPRTITFKTIKEAAIYANVNCSIMTRWIKNNKSVNNTIYKAKSSKLKNTPKYIVYRGHELIGKFISSKEVAKIVGVHRTTVIKKAKLNQTLGEFNQYRVKIKNV